MRSTWNEPARQLASVFERFRSPLAAARWADQLPVRQQQFADPESGSKSCESAANDSPHFRDPDLARLEAVLLVAREPLSSRKLSQFANLADGTKARTLVRRLNESYDASGRAFRVEQVAGGYQLLTRRKFAPWLRRLEHVPGETRLSAPALETLAVIAYRQPVPRADIEAVRGVNCGEILRQLMERDLVRIGGRSEELGRPYLYCTTKRFLNIFGLINLDELPRAEALRNAPLPAPLPPVPVLAEATDEEEPAEDAAENPYTDELA